jgi:hypothetical protein
MARKLFSCLLLFVLVAGLITGCGKFTSGTPQNGSPNQPPAPVKDAEYEISFTANELFTGESVNFPADFQGEVVYLGFYLYG